VQTVIGPFQPVKIGRGHREDCRADPGTATFECGDRLGGLARTHVDIGGIARHVMSGAKPELLGGRSWLNGVKLCSRP